MKKVLLVFSLLFISLAQAEKVDNNFKIKVGGNFIVRDDDLSLAVETLEGTDIDFQRDLGNDSNIEDIRVNVQYYFSDLHKIEFTYYRMHSGSTTSLSKDIVFDGNLYEAGVTIDSHLNMDIYKLSYAYSFYTIENFNMSASIGIHAMDIDAGLSGVATVDGAPVGSIVKSNYELLAPLPVIGLHMEYSLTPKIDLYGSVEYFGLSYDEYSGSFSDFYIAGEYKINDNVGVGAGLNLTYLDLEINKDNKKYDIDQKVRGIFAYLSYAF